MWGDEEVGTSLEVGYELFLTTVCISLPPENLVEVLPKDIRSS